MSGRSSRRDVGRGAAWNSVKQKNATTLISNHHQETWSPYLSKRDVRVIYLHIQRRLNIIPTVMAARYLSRMSLASVARVVRGLKGVLLSQGGIIIENTAGRSLTAGNQVGYSNRVSACKYHITAINVVLFCDEHDSVAGMHEIESSRVESSRAESSRAESSRVE